MTRNLGQTEELVFYLYKGKSFSFDLVWWLDAAKTQAAVITSVGGKIKTSSGADATELIDLAPTFENNRVLVRLTPVQTAGIDSEFGFLEVKASTVQETKPLIRGKVRIFAGVSE